MITIDSKAEEKANAAASLSIFRGFDLRHTKEILADMLADIGKHGMFTEYTKHDISHVDGMLKLLEEIIPCDVVNILTPTDWMMIVLSIYFHDLGMLITQQEFQERENNRDYQRFKKTPPKDYTDIESEDLRERKYYQDYVREHHGERIAYWIKGIGEQPPTESSAIEKLLYDMLHFVDANFRQDLADICQSHSEDFQTVAENLAVDRPYSQGNEYETNLLYVAAILRTADLMHINSERTPTVAYMLISPQDAHSRREWVKQRSVTAIRVKKEYNADHKRDDSIRPHRFEIVASFDDDNAYKSLMQYLDKAEEQLQKTHEICTRSAETNSNSYVFPWDSICREKIKTNKFSGQPLRFDLDTKNILHLLVGHTLYSQMNVVLRELTQNSIDAVRLMSIHFKEGDEDYTPTVVIEWDTANRILKVKDNGTGMNEHIIRNYLMKVGSSRYQSEEFKKGHSQFHSISRFGIGLLTCFMISDEFSIITKFHDDPKVYSLSVNGMEREFMLRYDAQPSELIDQEHGTTIKLNVRADANIDDIEERLRDWIIIPQCKVQLFIDGKEPVTIGYPSPQDAMCSYLRTQGITIDDKEYKLDYQNRGCAEIYYLLSKNKTFGYWELCTNIKLRSSVLPPIGYCVEGIRVSDKTPGFVSRKFFVLVNCVGHESPTTNVARDRLEDNKEMKEVISSVYKTYFKILQDQVTNINTRYSLPWAYQNLVRQIDSLLNANHDSFDLENREIFNERLMAEPFMLVDDGLKYQMISINDLSDEINTMESHAYSAAASLVKEIHGCSKTSLGITKELLPEDKVQVKRVYAENFFTYYFNQLFLSQYQVSAIRIDETFRKIEFSWIKDRKLWHCIDISSYRHYGGYRYLFIQTAPQVSIEPINDEIAIKTNLGFFLLKGNALSDLFCQLQDKDDERLESVMRVLGKYTERILSTPTKANAKDVDSFFNSDENTLRDDIWNIVGSKENFINIVESLQINIVDFSKYYES